MAHQQTKTIQNGDKKSDPNQGLGTVMSLLCQAALNGDADECLMLLKKGADPNGALANGFTPIMMGAHGGRVDCVEILLAAGGDPNASSTQGESALWLACLSNHGDGGNEASFPLLRAGADPNSGGLWGRKAIHEASWRADTTLLELLLSLGAGVDVVDDDGATPLMEAAANGNAKAVRLLMDHGADVNQRTPLGETAMQRAMGPALVLLLAESERCQLLSDSAGSVVGAHTPRRSSL